MGILPFWEGCASLPRRLSSFWSGCAPFWDLRSCLSHQLSHCSLFKLDSYLLFEDLDVHLRKSAMHPPSMFAKACLTNLKTKLTATSQRYWIGIGVHAIHVIAKRFPANQARSRARSLGVRDCGLAGLLLAWGPWLCHPNSIFDGLSRAPHPWKGCTGSWPSFWQTGQDPV